MAEVGQFKMAEDTGLAVANSRLFASEASTLEVSMDQLRELSHGTLRLGIIQALGALRAQQPRQTLFDYPTLILRAVRELQRPTLVWAAQNQTAFDAPPMGGGGPPPNEFPDNPRMLAAVWSLIGDGTLIPRFQPAAVSYINNGQPMVGIAYLSLTPLGEALVASTPDHPRLAGALRRLAERHPGMPPELTARLEDAVLCIDKGLARPAIVLVGLAMECALGEVAKALAQQAKLPGQAKAGTPNATERLADIAKACEQYYSGEERHRLRFACGHAEMVRERRNAAAHDAAETFSSGEANELLVLAAGATESFFSIVVAQPGLTPSPAPPP